MPDWTTEVRRRLSTVRLSPAQEAAIIDEIAAHLEDRYRELTARGISNEEASSIALNELEDENRLGELIGELSLPMRPEPVPIGARPGHGSLGGLLGDLRFGARMLRRAPAFTAIAVITIALGIGANTTVFSIINELLLRPLPGIARQDELVLLGRTERGEGFDTFSHPDFVDYRDGAGTVRVAAHYATAGHLGFDGASERVRLALVSGNYFEVLGATAARGRLLTSADDHAGADPAAVLGHALWSERFGGDEDVIGRRVILNGDSFTIAGVAAPGFHGVEVYDSPTMFVTLAMAPRVIPNTTSLISERGAVWLDMFARIVPEATLERARAELVGIAERLTAAYPETNEERGIAVSPGIGLSPGGRAEVRTFTGILLGVVVLVLLIACANVSNLLLARGAVREREMAVRASLGASRGRLVRQLLAEGFLLAALGGAAGLLLGFWSLRLVIRLPAFASSGLAMDPSLDWRVLGFCALTAAISGLLFSLPPAVRASRAHVASLLKADSPGGDARSRLRHGLLAAQLAISVVLLVVAGLFIRTLQSLHAVAPGFETRGVLVASIDVGLHGYDEQRGRSFYSELTRRVTSLPSVRGAAVARMVPLGGGGWDTRVLPEEIVPTPEDDGIRSDRNAVSHGYFDVMSIPIVRGRSFTPLDDERSAPVAIINAALAEQLWPNADPIGRRFRSGLYPDAPIVEVVGVVPTAKYRSLLEAPRAFFYQPSAQSYEPSMTLHVRTASTPTLLARAIEQIVSELDGTLPIYGVGTLDARLARSLGSQRTSATLVGAYGALALVLAGVGLYGSMGYAVSRRTRELGIRMALGAPSADVMRRVLGQAARIALAGVAIGLAAAVPASQLLRSQLFGVTPGDAATFVTVPLILIAVSVGAAYGPARRATRIDPVEALRAE